MEDRDQGIFINSQADSFGFRDLDEKKQKIEGRNIVKTVWRLLLISMLAIPVPGFCAEDDSCSGCHEKENPGIVADWKKSANAGNL